jgi:hypothetical protein
MADITSPEPVKLSIDLDILNITMGEYLTVKYTLENTCKYNISICIAYFEANTTNGLYGNISMCNVLYPGVTKTNYALINTENVYTDDITIKKIDIFKE